MGRPIHVWDGTDRGKLQHLQRSIIVTPETSANLVTLHKEVHNDLANYESLDTPSKLRIYKALNGAENAFADRPLLLDENDLFFGQNNEANKRKSVKPKVIGTAKVLSYGDLVEAEAERDKRSAMEIEKAGRSKSKAY